MKKQLYISSAFAMLFGLSVQAQEKPKDSNMNTEEVRVVKSYEATVVDAFKIKDTPQIGDEDNEKQIIKYSIFSFPVASTFAPEKGKAAEVDQDTLTSIFNNYALLGYGNFNTLQGQLGIAEKVGDAVYVAGFLDHISSQGGINGVLVDDNYSKSNLDFNVGSRKTNNDWNLNFGVSQQNFNWYGLPSDVVVFAPAQYDDRDFGQKYNDVHVGFNYNSNIGVFDGGSMKFKHFWDAFDSRENHFLINPKFNFLLQESIVDLDVKADYVNTQFADQLNSGVKTESNSFILALEPNIRFYSDDYSVQLGFGIANVSGKSNGEKQDDIVVYPKVKANYDLVKNIVIAYAGAEGGVYNNTYANFVSQNPFVSPDLGIKPTQQQFNIHAGLKGKLYHNISYNIRASYISEVDKAMFVNNAMAPIFNLSTSQVYQYGNSFGVAYDDVKTFNAYGELNLNFSDDATIDLSGEFNSYSAKNGPVFNLPETKLAAKVKVNFTDQWFGGLDVYFVGQRKDMGYVIDGSGALERAVVKLDSFADLNLNVGYKATDNWTIFAKGNNLFNQSYQSWNNYKVQGTQVLVGAMYKFNFKN